MKRRSWQIPPWTWSFVFAVVVLILIVIVSGRGGFTTLSFALSLAPYLVLVGIGQMLVISSGPGNIDVSVASVLSLAGFTSISASSASGSWMIGLLAGAGTGLAVSLISVFAITVVRIPPIVATLAAGLIATTFTQTIANGFKGTAAPQLKQFLNFAPAGVPLFAILIILVSVVVGLVLARTVYGRRLLAVGQARRAADYAGIKSARIVALGYLISGGLSGLAGAFLSAYIAPTVDLGGDYLLDSIAVVVIGGTLISGGRAVPAGVWGGALFFILLDGLLNLVGWNLAGQSMLKGTLVLAVLFLAGGVKRPKKVAVQAEQLGAETTESLGAAAPTAVEGAAKIDRSTG